MLFQTKQKNYKKDLQVWKKKPNRLVCFEEGTRGSEKDCMVGYAEAKPKYFRGSYVVIIIVTEPRILDEDIMFVEEELIDIYKQGRRNKETKVSDDEIMSRRRNDCDLFCVQHDNKQRRKICVLLCDTQTKS